MRARPLSVAFVLLLVHVVLLYVGKSKHPSEYAGIFSANFSTRLKQEANVAESVEAAAKSKSPLDEFEVYLDILRQLNSFLVKLKVGSYEACRYFGRRIQKLLSS